ncbi:MAG: DNA helicase UvrD [Candidatus Aenigmarchaeota archaeon]|nr:DNA helicase UvrD [Candidatus Aenigmarchaeota archaeon]
MQVINDFHIHSRFSRACSKDLTIENLGKYARIKGLNLLGTGDFTHPLWLKELKEKLTEDGSGILRTKDGFPFILSSEVSSIYSEGKKVRRVHNLILSPDFESVERINDVLVRRGANLKSDGRPIFGIPCPELVEIVKSADKRNEVIPAHAWTPWFSLFGSKSGFDSVKECYQDQARHIFALETGLSSDPAMNWRLSQLDGMALVSNSDCHSYWPWRMGREANVFEMKDMTYGEFIGIMKSRDGGKFLFTIEVNPEYGKYHLDGHRNCGVVMEPREAVKSGKICPKCRRPLTLGVLHRVGELADRPPGYVPKGAIPFKSLMPLSEIIAGIMESPVISKTVWGKYNALIRAFGSEFEVLLTAGTNDLAAVVEDKIAKAITDAREGRIKMQPGFDGEYGYPVFHEGRQRDYKKFEPNPGGQKNLLDFRASLSQ